jgi:hypothetical protein
MALLKDQQAGTSADNFTVGGNLSVTGTATGVTPASNDNTTKFATTAFVTTKVGTLGTMASQNANAVTITGGTINSITVTTIGTNASGTKTISASAPAGGSSGDVWYQI